MPDRRARRGHRSGIALALLAAFGLAVLLGLGTWQMERLQWKEALIAERRAAIAAPALALEHTRDALSLPDFRHVALRGSFRHDKELLVGPRTRNGTAGWHVVTPLETAAGEIVLIDRGFVPDALRSAGSRAAGRLPDAVTIQGMLRRPVAPGAFQPANDPEKGAWFRIDPAAMGQALGLANVAPFWVAADATAVPGGWPVGGAEAIMPPNNHLQYAITWYALAAALLVIYLLVRRGQSRDGPS